MSKQLFIAPLMTNIHKVSGDEGQGDVGGLGSADSTVDVDRPCSFDDWVNMYADKDEIFDFNQDGSAGDWDDYAAWIRSLGLSEEEIDYWLSL